MNTQPDPNPDKIFVREHLTDFEKLLFAQAEIKDLKKELSLAQIENGKLQAEIQELKHYINTSKEMTDIQAVRNSIDQLRKNNKVLTEENRRLREETRTHKTTK